MPLIQVRGTDHYYTWVTATGEPHPSGRKPILVFVHGWGGSARYWQTTAQALTDSFDCLLYDLRGFGRSTVSTGQDYQLESYAEDLAALLEALQIHTAIALVAHSMGASIATFFLNRYADRVKRAILTCSGIFEYDEQAFAAFYKFGGYVVKFRPRWLKRIPGMDRLFMARFLHRSLPRADSLAFLEDFLLADDAAALGTIFTSVSKQATEILPKEFASIAVPTLIIAGEHDRIIPAEMGRQAAALNTNLAFVQIANTAHFPMLEDAPAYLQQVREFLHS
jgi:proline iminopeptidase